MGKKVILKDVATLLNGRAYKQDELLDSGKYPVLRVGNFFSNRGWFYSDLELEDEKYCDNGDLLFAWSASFGPKIWDGGKVIFHYHIWKILTTPQIDKKYFYYFLENAADRIKESGHGIAMIHTTKSEMEQMELLLPEMEQQLQIATVLDKVSELINLRKEQLAKLHELVKARFVEMFGDPASNPMGWPKMSMHQAIDKGIIEKPLDGNHGEKHPKTSDYVSAGIPFIMANNLVDGSVDLENCAFITKEQADSLDKGFAHDGDVLLTHKGTIGRTAVLHTTYPYIMLTPQVTYYRPIHGLIPEFLKGYFDTEYFQGIIGNIASIGSTRAYIGITAQQELPLIVPPIEKQKSYATFVEQTNKTKLTIQASLDKLEVMKKALMQEYFG